MSDSFRTYLVHVLGYTEEEAIQAEKDNVRQTLEREDGLRPDLSIATEEDIIREFVKRMSFGKEDCRRPGMLETPERVAKSWLELFFGYGVEDEEAWVRDLLKEFEEPGADEMVVVRGVNLFSFCEHHLLPFFGTAAVGYVPAGGKVVGLSKLPRLVHFRMARLSTQERIGTSVADDLMKHLPGCRGAGIVIQARHLCMCARGACEPEAVTVTSSLRGVLRTDAAARFEFMHLAGVK